MSHILYHCYYSLMFVDFISSCWPSLAIMYSVNLSLVACVTLVLLFWFAPLCCSMLAHMNVSLTGSYQLQEISLLFSVMVYVGAEFLRWLVSFSLCICSIEG